MKKYVLAFLFSVFASLSFAKSNNIKLKLRDFRAVDTMQLVVTYSQEYENGLSLRYWQEHNLGGLVSKTIISRYNLSQEKNLKAPVLVHSNNPRYVMNVKIERIDENDCECYGYLCITDRNTNVTLFECYFDIEGNNADGVKARLVKVMTYFGKKLYEDFNHHEAIFKNNYIEIDSSKVDFLRNKKYKNNEHSNDTDL